MQNPINGTASMAHERSGWHRLGVAVGLSIVAVSAVVLFRLLRDIEPAWILPRPNPELLVAWRKARKVSGFGVESRESRAIDGNGL